MNIGRSEDILISRGVSFLITDVVFKSGRVFECNEEVIGFEVCQMSIRDDFLAQ